LEIGTQLRALRTQRGLTLKEMADRCGLSKGFISQAERGLASPSISTLTDMLACLGSGLSDFFSVKTDEKVTYTPSDMFSKTDKELLRGTMTWLVPDAQKNEMEPILLNIGQGGKSRTMPPNECEEFGYILDGSVYLVLGEKQIHMRRGDSFCLHPVCDHYIANAGKSYARVLWISTPPVF